MGSLRPKRLNLAQLKLNGLAKHIQLGYKREDLNPSYAH